MVENGKILTDECTQQVRTMGYMFGLLYYHFAKTLVEELGEEEGKRLILNAIRSYGHERGFKIKEEVQKRGLELTVENFKKFSDLPPLGWDSEAGKLVYCSYAQPWLEKGAEDLGNLYCEVDIALYEAYNPTIKVERLRSVLKGQECCEYNIE
ncbi:MAG: L-2-amino-thiazoline-4-carboxylic acid hydrolase [Candidatus Hodarchaeota archaeon]